MFVVVVVQSVVVHAVVVDQVVYVTEPAQVHVCDVQAVAVTFEVLLF